jgi:hypothetical protein
MGCRDRHNAFMSAPRRTTQPGGVYAVKRSLTAPSVCQHSVALHVRYRTDSRLSPLFSTKCLALCGTWRHTLVQRMVLPAMPGEQSSREISRFKLLAEMRFEQVAYRRQHTTYPEWYRAQRAASSLLQLAWRCSQQDDVVCGLRDKWDADAF